MAARHTAPASRLRMRLGIAVVVVAAVAGGLLVGRLALRQDPAASSDEPGSTETTSPVPRFSFELADASSISTGARSGPEPAVLETARAVRVVLSDLYREAFLDPAEWGAYEAAMAAFDTDAAGDARRDLELLTLGAGAASSYARVEPEPGTVSVTVLLDAGGAVVTAEATVSFSAVAFGPTGTVVTTVVSEGSFFFRPTPEGWKIYAYDVQRADQAG